MLDLFPEGFEEVELAGSVELAAFTAEPLDPRLETLGPVRADDVAVGWEETWKRFHRPVRVGPLWVGPPWEPPDNDAIPVVIDPGRAFGTGGHTTTRLCLELLLTCEPTSLLDLGSGSGVLAIAAAKLGFAPVTALDVDEAAVEATHANALANGVSIDATTSDVLVDSLPPASVVVANVDLVSVARVAERISAGRLIVSGYLASERPPAHAWRHVERREADGWAADLFEAGSSGAA
jgi:ribosomal protein L11 methyltransferase